MLLQCAAQAMIETCTMIYYVFWTQPVQNLSRICPEACHLDDGSLDAIRSSSCDEQNHYNKPYGNGAVPPYAITTVSTSTQVNPEDENVMVVDDSAIPLNKTDSLTSSKNTNIFTSTQSTNTDASSTTTNQPTNNDTSTPSIVTEKSVPTPLGKNDFIGEDEFLNIVAEEEYKRNSRVGTNSVVDNNQQKEEEETKQDTPHVSNPNNAKDSDTTTTFTPSQTNAMAHSSGQTVFSVPTKRKRKTDGHVLKHEGKITTTPSTTSVTVQNCTDSYFAWNSFPWDWDCDWKYELDPMKACFIFIGVLLFLQISFLWQHCDKLEHLRSSNASLKYSNAPTTDNDGQLAEVGNVRMNPISTNDDDVAQLHPSQLDDDCDDITDITGVNDNNIDTLSNYYGCQSTSLTSTACSNDNNVGYYA